MEKQTNRTNGSSTDIHVNQTCHPESHTSDRPEIRTSPPHNDRRVASPRSPAKSNVRASPRRDGDFREAIPIGSLSDEPLCGRKKTGRSDLYPIQNGGRPPKCVSFGKGFQYLGYDLPASSHFRTLRDAGPSIIQHFNPKGGNFHMLLLC